MIDVLFDSSALQEMLRLGNWSDVAEHCRSNGFRMIFAPDVLSEAFAGEKTEAVVARFKTIAMLCERLGKRRRSMALPIRPILAAEASNARPQYASEDTFWPMLEAFEDPRHMARRHHQHRLGVIDELGKERMLSRDEELFQKIESSEDKALAADREKLVRLLQGPYEERISPDHWLAEKLLRVVDPDGRVMVTEALADRARFCSLLCYAFLGDLIAISVALKDFKPKGMRTLGLKKGNWVDARIAATGAYCSLLVSEDGDMRWGMKYLRPSLPGIPIDVSLEQFLRLNPARMAIRR